MEKYTNRPSWNTMFLYSALHWSKRSHDIHTKHGCVFVKDKTIISHGYNGFIRDIPNNVLPLTRPEKDPFMIHAEQNAIFNCARNGISCQNATAYITGKPCLMCLQNMYQAGITRIVYSDLVVSDRVEDDDYQKKWNLIVTLIKDVDIVFIGKDELNYE